MARRIKRPAASPYTVGVGNYNPLNTADFTIGNTPRSDFNADTITYAPVASDAATSASKKPLLANFFSRFGKGKNIGGDLDFSALKNLSTDIRETRLFGGPKIGQIGAAGMGIYQGGKALKGLYENINADTDLESLKNDIKLQMVSNPMYDMYMDAGDEKLVRQINNGTLTNNWGGAATGAVRGIPKAALTAIVGGIIGGPAGAALGGLGSLANSGIEGYGQGTQEANSKLQGLYDRLRQANEEYRTMKRPSGLRTAGLSRQYYNQLY